MTSNALLDYLDRIGLPWRSPRAVLAAQYGVRAHAAYSWNVIEIETTHPIVEGLLWPISAQVFPQFSPAMPATEFSGAACPGEHARENLRLTMAQLVPILGAGEATGSANCVGHRWNIGPASLTLNAWPAELQRWPTNNPAHEREPRLKEGCHLFVSTGFRPLASARERILLDEFEPIARIEVAPRGLGVSSPEPPPQRELMFVRQSEDAFLHCHGWIGHSADRSTLIFFGRELYLVSMQDVLQFQVTRIKPAKGAGGAWLSVACRRDDGERNTQILTICTADGPDDLNELASSIANATGKPFELLPYEYDA